MSNPKIAFEMRKIRLSLAQILPVRQIKDTQKKITRYKTILASIQQGGLVEPLVVYPQKDSSGKYLLLDGHLRYFVLKDLGETEVDCIIATDDESFTYNARVNRLNPIQEHKMIVKAVNNGVKPEKIAAALNLSVGAVKASMSLLDGINAEAADLLKDKSISPKAIRLLKRVTGVRQIEIAELMVSANNFTAGYADALVLGTPKDQLANGLFHKVGGQNDGQMSAAVKTHGDFLFTYFHVSRHIDQIPENLARLRVTVAPHSPSHPAVKAAGQDQQCQVKVNLQAHG